MFKGFYMATSGMLSQSRILNTVSNNMANASTPGYKKDLMETTTFEDVLIHRTGNYDKSKYTPLNDSASIRTVQELVTNYSAGMLEFTEMPLDCAIVGKGFFHVKTPGGQDRYTRNGSFNLDGSGHLWVQHIGRVVGKDGQPIRLDTDNININSQGRISDSKTGRVLGDLEIVDFQDYAQLRKADEGMFEHTGAPQNMTEAQGNIKHKALERSNVEAMDEMLAMLASQRAFQSAGNIAKAYDQIMAKATELSAL